MKFTIQVSDFKEFLDLVKGEGKTLSGEDSTIADDALVQVTEKGLKTHTQKDSEAVVATVRYQVDEVHETGSLAIGSIDNLKDYLDRFKGGDEITVELEDAGAQGERIALTRDSPKKKAKINAVGEEAIESKISEDHEWLTEKFVLHRGFNDEGEMTEDRYHVSINDGEIDQDHDVKVSFKARDMRDVLDDCRVVNEQTIPIEIGKGSITVNLGEEAIGGFETSVPGDVQINDEDIVGNVYKFGEGVENIYPNVSGEVEVYFVENLPAYIVAQDSDKGYRADYIQAPVGE